MAIANSVANISSTFYIKASWDSGTGSMRIANPGRAFRVLQCYGTGTTTAVITLQKEVAGVAGVTVATCTLVAAEAGINDAPAVMTLANEDFAITDDLLITVATAAATEVSILCVATGGGQALTATDVS